MLIGQLHLLKRALICSLILLGISCGPLWAGPVVDLDQIQPLGAVTKNAAGDQAWFSLGNGRALQFSLTRQKTDRASLTDLLARNADKSVKARPVKRRNLKW